MPGIRTWKVIAARSATPCFSANAPFARVVPGTDPRRRTAYDSSRLNDGALRIQLAEARANHQKKDAQERQGKTPQGRQFYQKAMQCLDRGDNAGAVSNLQMALTFEPGNNVFKQQLAAAKAG